MKKHFDEIITWPGFHGGGATVQIQIFDDARNPGGHVVIMSEPDDNKGTSITNGVELVAARVVNDHDLDPSTVTFVERYPNRPGFVQAAETFDVVDMVSRDVGRFASEMRTEFRGATWRRISFDEVKHWIGSDASNWTEL